MTADRAAKAMAAIGGTVAVASAASPRRFLRPFGIAAADVTGSAAFGWRLFAARTAYLSARAWQGDPSAREAFLPVQLLDQAVFWHAYATRSIPRPCSRRARPARSSRSTSRAAGRPDVA